MLRSLFVLFLMLVFLSSANTQIEVDREAMVGFGCSVGGSPSTSVSMVAHLVYSKKYDKILNLLDSNNSAEKYLAVIVIEELNKSNKVSLTDDHHLKISNLYRSSEIVSVCSGCTYWDKVTLKSMLQKDHHMRMESKYWLKDLFKLR